MELEFTCNGYDKTTYEETTYVLVIPALPDFAVCLRQANQTKL